MAELNDWQWAIGAAVLITSLVIGGWMNRERIDEVEDSELSQLRQLLEARDSELKDARGEAELTLLHLHQVQEELEHYFLESRDLQQKMDSVQAITPEQQEQLKRISARLLELFKVMPSAPNPSAQAPSGNQLEALVKRQQNALRRFERLHAVASDAQQYSPSLAALGGSETLVKTGRRVRSQIDA